MSDFAAFFPSTECAQLPRAFSKVEKAFRGPLRADHVQAEVLHGAAILRSRSFGNIPRFYVQEDGAGWLVAKGHIFDTQSANAAVDLRVCLGYLLAGDLTGLNRFEGTFALAAWDAQKQQGWVVNDQTSMLNLYYGEHDGGLYVSTNAVSLASALGLGLDPGGVQEFLARNVLLAPTTMFTGLRRLNIGEHVCYRRGAISHGKHWYGYEPQASYKNLREAADTAARVVVDRVARYAASSNSVVSDLTGGLDSRLLASAAQAADSRLTVTVNGPPNNTDVKIAYEVADAMNWDVRYFDTQRLSGAGMIPDIRRELLYRSHGELPITKIYQHALSRPQLAQNHDLHILGSGGELFRYFPWGQEFFGIGKRQLANVNNVLDYRFLTDLPPPSLFPDNWLPAFRDRLGSRIETICHEQPRSLTTQQLDAVYIWKMTSHSSLYMSAVYNWLPSVAPLLSAGVVKTLVAMPWTMRLTSRLQRQTIQVLGPRVARVVTAYGGTAEPVSLENLHLAALQSVRRGLHLVKKLDSVLLKGKLAGRRLSNTSVAQDQSALLTNELRNLLASETMLSRALYNPQELRKVLAGSDQALQARASLVARLATVEELCREIGFEPQRDFLTSAPTADAGARA